VVKQVEGKDAFIAKRALIETRKDQYVIKNAFKKPITLNSTIHSHN
jgi:hypothetical protein